MTDPKPTWTIKNHGTAHAYGRMRCRCEVCRAGNAARAKAYRASNAESRREYDQCHRLEKRYGVTVEQYETTLAEQGGVCAICGGQPQLRRGLRRFGQDHDHSTGQPRGVLCSRCNSAIGFLDDDPTKVEAALAYLRKWQA